jgi:cystathionine beta-lyase/cystathionine gamma-synthase
MGEEYETSITGKQLAPERLSVGVERPDDLIHDLSNAFVAIRGDGID